MNAWLTPEQANLVGALGGAAMGIAGALVGSLAGMLVPRGKGKTLVVGLLGLVIVCGVGALLVAAAALAQSQPRYVVYPFVLVGLVATPIGAVLMPVLLGRYRQAEQRRMEAEELRRS